MRPVMSSRHSRAGLWICRPYGTPGYRLFHPHSTSSGQALRDYGTAEAVPFRLHLYCGSWVHLGYDLGHVRASARTFEGRPPLSLLKLPLTEYALQLLTSEGCDFASRQSRAGLFIMPSPFDKLRAGSASVSDFYFCEGDFINATNMLVNFGRSKST